MTPLQTLSANLSGDVKRKTLNGREYLVAPVSMIVADKVLNGSQGALFYPADEVQRNPGAWNGVPLTIGHPVVNGKDVSAREPETAEKFQIGVVYNDRFENGKRLADGWFDVQLTKKKAPSVYNSLVNGKPVELSTGLFTDNEPTANGKAPDGTAYTHVARNYRPDHLAILPHQRGACSLKDGCGLMVGNSCEGVTNCGGEGGTPGPCKSSGGPKKAGRGGRQPTPSTEVGPEGLDTGLYPVGQQFHTPGTRVTVKPNSGSFSGTKGKITSGPHKRTNGKPGLFYRVKLSGGRVIEMDQSALTKNQQEPTMNRDQMISRLVTNCECWKGKEKVLANEEAFTDDDLLALNADLDAKTRNALVANSLAKAVGLDSLDVVTDNEMPAFIKEKIAAKEGDAPVEDEEEDDEEEMPLNKKVKNKKVRNSRKANDGPMTPAQFEATIAASPALAAVWNAAKSIETQSRAALVQKLTANVKDPNRRQLLVNEFSDRNKYDLDRLEAMTAMLPAPARKTFAPPRQPDAVTNRFAPAGFQYVGPGNLNLANNAEPTDDVLDIFDSLAPVGK